MAMDNLEKLKKKLYQKGRKFSDRLKRETLRQEENQTSMYWQKEDTEKKDMSDFPILKNGIFKRLKIFVYLLVVFVVLAGGAAAYLIYSGGNIVSSSNVSIDANGPIYVDGGQPARFNFTIRNQKSVSLDRIGIPLENLEPGAEVNKSLDIVFWGLENEEKKITANFEYRFAESN